MKNTSKIIASILLAATSHAAFAETNETIAIVNGSELKQSILQVYAVERRQNNPQDKISTDQLTEDIVNMQLLKEEALNKGLNKDSEFSARMDLIKLSMLSQVAMLNFLENNPIPDALLKKEYDAKIGDINVIELKASHILLEDAAKAEEVIGKLDKGSDFAKLAKEYSTGPTGSKGGDLGWFSPQRMVPEFSEAVMKLKDGKYTKKAVRTQFGWHVILRSGKRNGTPPSFESAKPNIATALKQEHIRKHIAELRKKAKIEIIKKPAK